MRKLALRHPSLPIPGRPRSHVCPIKSDLKGQRRQQPRQSQAPSSPAGCRPAGEGPTTGTMCCWLPCGAVRGDGCFAPMRQSLIECKDCTVSEGSKTLRGGGCPRPGCLWPLMDVLGGLLNLCHACLSSSWAGRRLSSAQCPVNPLEGGRTTTSLCRGRWQRWVRAHRQRSQAPSCCLRPSQIFAQLLACLPKNTALSVSLPCPQSSDKIWNMLRDFFWLFDRDREMQLLRANGCYSLPWASSA